MKTEPRFPDPETQSLDRGNARINYGIFCVPPRNKLPKDQRPLKIRSISPELKPKYVLSPKDFKEQKRTMVFNRNQMKQINNIRKTFEVIHS